jgi:hypothetical protein
LIQAEQHYQSAIEKRPDAPQPRHGLVQLYARIKSPHNLALALQGLLQETTQSEEVTKRTRKELARALLDDNQIDAASDLIRQLVQEHVAGNGHELPPELVILQADSQIAHDEREFEKRLQARLQEDRRTSWDDPSHTGQSQQRHQVLAQEVSATWVRFWPMRWSVL